MVVVLAVTALAPPPVGARGSTSTSQRSASKWTNVHAAAGSGRNQLNAVTCATASFCVAVGLQDEGAGGEPLIEQWNGTAWSVITGDVPPASTNNTLNSVSCAGQSFCMAVGSTETGALAEMWNGSTWAATTVTPPTDFNGAVYLSSVSCVAANSCQALGTGFAVVTPTEFGERWNGTAWSAVPAATPKTAADQEIAASGMDCISATQCLAVGTTAFGSPDSAPFAERWNGTTWSLADTGLSTTLPGGSFLSSMSCVRASFCEAVGQVGGRITQNLIEMWNGSRWSLPPSTPQTSTSLGQGLTGVHCSRATSCSAVGFADQTSGQSPSTLALTWSGVDWSIVSNTPNGSGTGTNLNAETCLTDWACVAVGFQITAGSIGAFAMRGPWGQGPAPTVTTQPKSQYYSTGQSLTFDAAASGVPTPTVQWQYSTNGDTWTNLSGATSATLVLGPLNGFWNNVQVRAMFANTFGSAISQAATMTLAATSIVQPVNGATEAGKVGLVATAASGATEVRFKLTGGSLINHVIATGSPTLYGWLTPWNTTSVSNGTYTLESVASYPGGVSGTSASISITVAN
jgi:hypothetical protein